MPASTARHTARPRRTVAVVLAGGTGSRVGGEMPKQLIEVAGRTVLEHTLTAVGRSAAVDEILLLMHPDHIDEARRLASGHPKVAQVLAGGATRSDTTRIALEAIAARADPKEDPLVLLHDAARPLVDDRIIGDVVAALADHDAVTVAIPSADTLVVVDDDGLVTAMPDRARVWRSQTPQGFRLSVIRAAFERATADPAFTATDDCSVVFAHLPDVPIAVVRGSTTNLKVTHPEDVAVLELLLRERSDRHPDR